jgi:hypothetical protein
MAAEAAIHDKPQPYGVNCKIGFDHDVDLLQHNPRCPLSWMAAYAAMTRNEGLK